MDPSLYELAVLSDGLLKAPGLYQKHKRMPLPTSKSGSRFQGMYGYSKTIQIGKPYFGTYYFRMGTQNCSIISTAFQPHKQAIGSPVGSLIIHADV